MHPTDAIAPSEAAADAPAGHDLRSEATWDLARRDYLAGDSRTQVCDRYGLCRSTFDDRARRKGWRKCDQPDPDPIPDDDPEADEPVDCAALAEDALVRVRRALRRGRAGEAASWMRLHEKLTARLDAGREAAARRERVARARGSEAATEAVTPLRDRMAAISGVTVTHLRLTRAWQKGVLTRDDYRTLSALNDGAIAVLRGAVSAPDARAPEAPAAGSHSSHPDFSAAPDP